MGEKTLRIRLLPGGKFLSGGVVYKPGDLLPDTPDTRRLAERKLAALETAVSAEADADAAEAEKISAEAGEYEAQKVKELTDLAQERGIELPRSATKSKIIGLLKEWDADSNGDERVS